MDESPRIPGFLIGGVLGGVFAGFLVVVLGNYFLKNRRRNDIVLIDGTIEVEENKEKSTSQSTPDSTETVNSNPNSTERIPHGTNLTSIGIQ